MSGNMQDSTGAMFEQQIDRQALVTLVYLYMLNQS